MNSLSLEEKLPHAHARNFGLDIIRAAAILLVMVSHWSNNILFWFGIKPDGRIFFSGDLGVELFFALSGFLIGQILISQAGQNPSLSNLRVFLVRRWLRTLPLYFLVLILLLLFFPPAELVLRYALKFGTLTQNLFKPPPPGWWYAVSWSLAVEEWFYLLFGCAVFLSFRIFRAGWAIWPPTAIFILVPLALRLGVPGFSLDAGGMGQMVFFRMDAIAYGVAMAQLYRQGSWLFRHPLVCLAAGLGLLAMLWAGHAPLPAALVPALIFNLIIIACALLLPWALTVRVRPGFFHSVVSAISAQSYGLYLIHLTILVDVAQTLWFRHIAPVWVCVGVAVIAPFALSYLSFRFLEAPILSWRPAHRPPQPGAPVAAPVTASV